MMFLTKAKSLIFRRKPKVTKGTSSDITGNVLREFVYLDEVSLRSLLSSQKDGVTDSTSEQRTDADLLELGHSVGVEQPFIAKAEVSSRYQTSNSRTVETSRKATVQSWFRELLAIPDLRLIKPTTAGKPAESIEALKSETDACLVTKSCELLRGSIVEFRVTLSADPVFHLGTIMSELAGMAEDYPSMFSAGNTIERLREVQPINRLLQRLLVGLIPIRAIALDYSVVKIEDVDYIVHNRIFRDLAMDVKPLVIVGVTEHLAYWKDIRRVLFSEAEFTILCRISRSELQESWTPVKIADLFRVVDLNLVDKINAAGRIQWGAPTHARTSSSPSKMLVALRRYQDALLEEWDTILSDDQRSVVDDEIRSLESWSESASNQRAAFARLKSTLMRILDRDIHADRDLELRNQARDLSGLSLFPTRAAARVVSQPAHPVASELDERLLDVEVIAIYW